MARKLVIFNIRILFDIEKPEQSLAEILSFSRDEYNIFTGQSLSLRQQTINL
jgi:hypothetical protein